MTTPEQIKRYQMLERLGSGGFATVWRARDTELDTEVAVKVLAENWVSRGDVRDRFLEEARILRRADSDRVVRVYDIGTLPDERPFFVMSYADRGTLADVITSGELPVDVALRYAEEVARGVAVLHSLGVLHRDIKPSNVLIRTSGSGERLMVADLGLAKAVAHASGYTVNAGTPGYMAPEQTRPGEKLDERADVYALGALTYRLLTGRVPHTMSTGTTPAPSRERADLPTGTDAVVLRATAADSDARWPDAASLADAVHELAGKLQEITVVPPVRPPDDPPTSPVRRPLPPWPGPDKQRRTSRDAKTVHPSARRPRLPRRRTFVTAVAGVCAVALAITIAAFYWPTAWKTVRSEDGAIEVTVPRDWVPQEPRGTTLDEASDYGASQVAVRFDVGRFSSGSTEDRSFREWSKPGITIVADDDLYYDDDDASAYASRNEPHNVMENLTSVNGWPAGDCQDSYLESIVPATKQFSSGGKMWTFQPSCSSKPRYAEAVLNDKSYGINAFLTGDDTKAFAKVAASIKIDGSKLPGN